MECDLLPYFWLHLQIGTFSCRWGQLFLRCLLRCGIIRLNYPKNAGQILSPFPFSSSLFGPASLCFPVGMPVSDGRRSIMSSLFSALTCTVRGCRPVLMYPRDVEVWPVACGRERERQRQSRRGPSVHLWPWHYSHHHPAWLTCWRNLASSKYNAKFGPYSVATNCVDFETTFKSFNKLKANQISHADVLVKSQPNCCYGKGREKQTFTLSKPATFIMHLFRLDLLPVISLCS